MCGAIFSHASRIELSARTAGMPPRFDQRTDSVTPQASFIEDLGADSLDIVELVMALEEEYDMEISDEEAEKIRTVQDVVTYIESHK